MGTITEIYDFLRLLFARIGVPYCPVHNEPIKSQTINEMLKSLMTLEDGARITIMAPVVKQKKGTHKDLLSQIIERWFYQSRN